MNQVGTYNNLDYQIRRVYFTNSVTLQTGQALCYQENPATASTTGIPSTVLTDTAAAKGFPFDVQIPDANSLRVFAGIVSDTSVGVTGPAYIDIVVPRPGDILKVRAGRSADIATGVLLKLNATVGTQTVASVASTLGAWDAFSVAITSSADFAVANVLPLYAIDPLVRLLESVASSNTSVGLTSLVWVKFQ